MGSFIGTAGGLLMVVLIAALLLRFLRELGVISCKRKTVLVLLMIVGTGLGELFLCGVYQAAKAPGTSVFDIPNIWDKRPLFLTDLWPLNWYLSLICGTIFFWNVYQIAARLWGDTAAEKLLLLAMAVPGAYLLFLPIVLSPAASAVSVIAGWTAGRALITRKTGRGRISSRIRRFSESAFYALLLCLLAVINGVTVIIALGI